MTTSIVGLTISGRSPASGAGGLANGGTVTLTHCTLSGNTAFTSRGGLSDVGKATPTDCTLSGNNVHTGGGSVSNGGTADLTDCTISGNSVFDAFGGGMYNHDGTAYLTDCTSSGNSATDGGLVNDTYWENQDGPVTLTDTIVAGNTNPCSNPNDFFGRDILGSFNGYQFTDTAAMVLRGWPATRLPAVPTRSRRGRSRPTATARSISPAAL